jgi:chromosome segregation ATPase
MKEKPLVSPLSDDSTILTNPSPEGYEDLSYEEAEEKTSLHFKSKPKLFPFGNNDRHVKNNNFSQLNPILTQSENLKIAQKKIIELEKEMERLRIENEELAAAGGALEKRVDELLYNMESKQQKFRATSSSLNQEKELLLENLKIKTKEVSEKSIQIEKLEARLATNIRKVRFRERELENRLEIVKMENAAIIRNKDEIILDLKRQIDQINQDLEKYKNKTLNMAKEAKEKNEVMRRTVKALRLALSLLEGHDESVSLKRVD